MLPPGQVGESDAGRRPQGTHCTLDTAAHFADGGEVTDLSVLQTEL